MRYHRCVPKFAGKQWHELAFKKQKAVHTYGDGRSQNESFGEKRYRKWRQTLPNCNLGNLNLLRSLKIILLITFNKEWCPSTHLWKKPGSSFGKNRFWVSLEFVSHCHAWHFPPIKSPLQGIRPKITISIPILPVKGWPLRPRSKKSSQIYGQFFENWEDPLEMHSLSF